jgi:general secretion pathway protein D
MFDRGKVAYSNCLFFMGITFCIIILFSNVVFPAEDKVTAIKNDSSELVSIDFNDVDIKVFIRFISKITGANFVIDKRVKGQVSIISPTKVSIKEAYKIFESVLEINGFALVKAGEVFKVIPSPDARAQNVDTRMSRGIEISGDKTVTRIIKLNYARSDELKRLFTPLVPKGSIILSYRDTNMLIITATSSSINRLLKIINVIDVKSVGRKITVIPIKYANAKKLVSNLSKIFSARLKADKKTSSDFIVKFVADERTNAIILLSSELETGRVKRLVDLLDKKVPRGGEKIHVYYLEHASAEKLAKVLQTIPTKTGKKQGKKVAPIISSDVKITADKATNSLIIMADKEDYPILEKVIAKLDIPRSMVYIECLIMEVNVNKGLNIGTEWRVGNEIDNNSKILFSGFSQAAAPNFSPNPNGFSVGVMGKAISIGGLTFPSVGAVAQAYRNDKDVHILSTPQILTTDNEEASITVGKNIPYQTRSAAEDATETYSSYEYKDVGIALKITPQISKGNLVRLNVHQKVTKLDTVNQNSPDRPTTYKREIMTTIIVEDKNTIVIGGLIDTSFSEITTKVPCIGDIPVLGFLFKKVSKGDDKTNLYVFLTPKVIKNPVQAQEIFKDKKERIDKSSEIIDKGEVNIYRELIKNGFQ